MKSKQKNILIVTAVAFVLFVCTALGLVFSALNGASAKGTDGLTLIGGEIQEEYILGDLIEIPEAQLVFNGETKDAEIYVIKPDGERVRSAKVKLEVGGEYKAEYKALFGGKAKTVEKDFTVKIPLFSTTSKKTTWEYGVDDSDYETGKSGVKVRLSKGDTLTYNEIIDLKKSDGQIIDFFLLPEDGVGTKDLKKITITLTDLYDPSVSLTIILQCAHDHGDESKWWFDPTYVLAGGQNQIPSGVEGKGTQNEKLWVGGDWGCSLYYSFYGTHSSSKGASVVGTESLNVVYDEYENAVYVNGVEVINLSDLTRFDDPWGGFKTGEVKMSITGDVFTKRFASMMITRIGVNNLDKEYYVDDVAPEMNVDFGEYSESSLPAAGKGLSYPVFNATAMDKIFGEVDVKTTVYYNYESQQRYQVDIKDGRFATDEIGPYTIEYLAYDGYKNESKKLVTVNCVATTPSLSVQAEGEYVTDCGTGELIFPAKIKYVGGTGVVKTYATAKSQSGNEFVIDQGFRPEEEGVYKITLHAEDMLGKTATFTYDLTVTINNEPVFIEEPILPRFFLQGYNYTLPTIPAYDYSSGTERKQIATTIAIQDGKDGGAERDLDANVADFVADADGFATIIYKATGAKGSNAVAYKVRVIDAWRDFENYAYDMTKYFYGENIEATADKNSVTVNATTATSYTFVNPVIAHKFETKFFISGGDFTCLQLVLEDSKDPNVKFTIEIDKSNSQTENAPLRINSVAKRYRPLANYYNGKDFYFSYDELNKVLRDDASLKADVINTDGSAFTGFPSGLIYVTVNVNGSASISWKNFAGQILSNNEYDIIGPSIKLSADYASKYQLNTVAEIYSAVAADVLSPEVYTSITVKDPNGNIMTDVDGLKLENVPFDRSYFIKLEMYGSYSVKYTAIDWMEREQEYPFALLVVDDQKPAITLEDEIPSEVKKGKSVTIPSAAATDNVDDEVDVYVYLVEPSGVMKKVSFGEKVKLSKAGVYQIRYLSIDAFGNLNILYYDITVA